VTDQATLQQAYDTALAELKDKERKLVIEYLRDLHQQNAAIRTGYTPEYASKILRNLKIRKAIDAGLALHAMPADEILARLSQQARGSMADFLRVDEEEITLTWSLLNIPTTEDGELDVGGAMLRLAMHDNVAPTDRVLHTATVKRSAARLDLMEAGMRGLLGLVKKYTIDEKGKIAIELYDAQAALQLLGRHHKLFTDRTELTGKDGGPIETSDARSKLLDLLTKRAAAADEAPDPDADRGSG
jgi:phage terminase small subunit